MRVEIVIEEGGDVTVNRSHGKVIRPEAQPSDVSAKAATPPTAAPTVAAAGAIDAGPAPSAGAQQPEAPTINIGATDVRKSMEAAGPVEPDGISAGAGPSSVELPVDVVSEGDGESLADEDGEE